MEICCPLIDRTGDRLTVIKSPWKHLTNAKNYSNDHNNKKTHVDISDIYLLPPLCESQSHKVIFLTLPLSAVDLPSPEEQRSGASSALAVSRFGHWIHQSRKVSRDSHRRKDGRSQHLLGVGWVLITEDEGADESWWGKSACVAQATWEGFLGEDCQAAIPTCKSSY